MKKLLLIVVFLQSFSLSFAIPAKRGQWKQISLSDGTKVKAELVGDEFMHFWQTEDGRKYIQNAATKEEFFQLANMEALIKNANHRRLTNTIKQQTRARSARVKKAYTGKKKGLIILMQFPDLKFQTSHNNTFYQRIINERGFSEGDFIGSVSDYFYDQSNGQFELNFDIAGPYMANNYFAFYGQNDEDGQDKNPGKLIVEAVENAAKEYDFTQYDWDGDNEVDQVYVLYAGQGEANGGSADTIWPHEWQLESATGSAMNINNMRVDTYACGSELGGSENITSGIGTFCHEFTHCLGIPDMYDTAYSGNYGTGSWDPMCSGSYNGNSFCPAGYTSYEKTNCGWVTPIELKEDAVISNLKPLNEGGDVYIIYNDNYHNEYYLLECRNKTGWDSGLAGSGLLVLHIDYNPDIWMWNKVNSFGDYYDAVYNKYTNDHQRCTIIAADNALSRNNEACDPFPFNKRNYLSNVSSPAATVFNRNTDSSLLMNKAIRSIQRHEDGTVSFCFDAVDTQKEASFEGILFEETFDKCSGNGGNDGTWTNSNYSFTPDNVGWDYGSSTTSASGGLKCARFGSRVSKVTLSFPKVFVGEESTLTFKAAPYADENTRLTVSILGSPNTTISPSIFTLTPGQWTECEATIKGKGDITIRITSSNNRYFLDEVKIVAGSGSGTGIRETQRQKDTDDILYSFDGRNLGNNPRNLRHGVYIINKKKVIK